MATSVTHAARIERTVLQHAFKGAWDAVQNHRPVFQALKKRGHINKGVAGKRLDWDVRVARHDVEAYDDLQRLEFARKNQYILAQLPWGMLAMKDVLSRDEIAMASGPEAMEAIHKRLITNMTDDFQTRVNYQFLRQDGAASGAGNVLHGVPTFTAGSDNSAAEDATMSDTYATHSTALNGLTGVDGADADAWTPSGIDSSATAWTNFNTSALKIVNYAIDKCTKGSMAKDRPDLLVFDRALLSTLKAAVTAQQSGHISGTPSGTQGLGIPGALEINGVECVFDADMASGEAYVLNFNHIHMDLLPVPEIVEGYGAIPDGGKSGKTEFFEVLVDSDIGTNGILVRVNFRAQFRFHPRYQGIIKAY